MKLKNNNLKIITIAIVLFTLIGATVYFYVQQSSKKTEQTITKESSDNDTEIPSTLDIVEIDPEIEEATAEVVEIGQNEGWLPIQSLFDENGVLKAKYYSQNSTDSDIDKLPYTSNTIGDFKWRAEFHFRDQLEGSLGQFKDQCFGYCVIVNNKLLTSVEATVFTGAFIIKDHLVEVIAHKGSGAYMPVNYTFIKIDKAGNAELIKDDHDSYHDQLARINHSGFEIDLRPFRKLQYFLMMNENGLSVSLKKPMKEEVKTTQCKEYYQGTIEACPTLHGCDADVVVQSLSRAYASYVSFSFHDPNIDEKKFNQICFKVCRNENVSYEEFENSLCKV